MEDFNRLYTIVNLLLTERERKLTEEEQSIIDNWLEENDGNKQLYQSLKDETNIPTKLQALSKFNKDDAFNGFNHRKVNKLRPFYRKLVRYAAIAIPFIFAIWLIFENGLRNESNIEFSEIDIKPGGSKAILKLSNGKKVNLEEEKEFIAEYNGTSIFNTKDEIVYSTSKLKIRERKIEYNTIEIPRGGEYRLTLSDGTKVWLNSETIIKYPVKFLSDAREVCLNGEAYFEVAENKQKPFIVNSSRMNVNVLGTSFNVKTYANEIQSIITLVSGKVLIQQPETNQEKAIHPNQQAIVSDQDLLVQEVDIRQAIAWKEGRILFEENTLDYIFNELARWYDVNLFYENEEIRNYRFSIDIKRYENFNEIMEILETTKKIKFKINENAIEVMKNQ